MKNLGNLMKQAQQMQSKMAEMQAKMAELEVGGASGGGPDGKARAVSATSTRLLSRCRWRKVLL